MTSLHTDAAGQDLLALLRQFMAEPVLSRFALAGGTALALCLGHRRSVDIDMFTPEPFDANLVADALAARYDMRNLTVSPNTVRGEIRGIKVDFIAHQYALLEPIRTVDGVRMFSLPDLAAMKLNAIANRGSRKDFYDVAELLGPLTLDVMLGFHARKYPRTNLWQVRKSLTYFADAESEPDPVVLNRATWESVKSRIGEAAPLPDDGEKT